jgi:hypothetical protein
MAAWADAAAGTFSFKDDDGDVHGWYDADTIRHWARSGYLTSETEVRRRTGEEGEEQEEGGGFEWLGLVAELTEDGLGESMWYYQVEEGRDVETHGPYGIFVLHAWIVGEMLDYETLRVMCASTGAEADGDGFAEMARRADWDECGVYDGFVLLKDVPNVFSAGDGSEEAAGGEEGAAGEAQGEAAGDHSMASVVSRDVGGLHGKSEAERKSEFFNSIKAEKEEKERKKAAARAAKLNSMTAEERGAFLAAEEAEAQHVKNKDKMLRKQMKGMKSKGLKKKGKKGRLSRASTHGR